MKNFVVSVQVYTLLHPLSTLSADHRNFAQRNLERNVTQNADYEN